MANALIVDYYGTIADPQKVDEVLKPLATENSFRGIYNDGAQNVLKKMLEGAESVINAVRGTFYPEVAELFGAAQRAGLNANVYSNGHGKFIIEGLNLVGVKATFVDPDTVGSKNEAESYRNLRRNMGYESIIFATDSEIEVRAALVGGIDHVVLVDSLNPNYSKLYDLIKVIR